MTTHPLSSLPWIIAPTCHSDHAPPVDSLPAALHCGDATWAPYAKLLAYGMAVSGRRSDPAPPGHRPGRTLSGMAEHACLHRAACGANCESPPIRTRRVVLLLLHARTGDESLAMQWIFLHRVNLGPSQYVLFGRRRFFSWPCNTARPTMHARGAAGWWCPGRGSARLCEHLSMPAAGRLLLPLCQGDNIFVRVDG